MRQQIKGGCLLRFDMFDDDDLIMMSSFVYEKVCNLRFVFLRYYVH